MPKIERILNDVLSGKKDNNIKFSDLQKLLEGLGFSQRIKGDHHIFFQESVEEIINIQPEGNKAKAYQVKQVRNIILNNKLEVL